MKLTITILITLLAFTLRSASDNGILGHQLGYYECRKPKSINPQHIELKPGQLYFHFNTDKNPESLDEKGFRWIKEYNPNDYFEAFLVNMTDSTFRTVLQDGSLLMIQEALDIDGNWRPIEYWTFAGCLVSYFESLELKTGESSLVPVKKYTGDFKTKARLKLLVNENNLGFIKNYKILYSDTFEISIDISQFEKPKGEVNGAIFNGYPFYFDEL